MRKRGPWYRPPWFDVPGGRINFIRQLRDLRDVRVGRDAKHRSGFVVSFLLDSDVIETRAVTIQFLPRSPDTPLVYVDGPTDSPHRYDDGHLCMWYPYDPPALRWAPQAGAADLVTRIAVHLIKEEWYRLRAEWIGEEVQHYPARPR